jgi:S1-C subfamily serine protease
MRSINRQDGFREEGTMRRISLYIGWAAAGAALAVLTMREPHQQPAAAADGQPNAARPAGPPRGPRQPPDDWTPEERVNISVYENVNRSVVNINTKGVREGDFFFFETPIEGAGSGSILDKSGHVLTNYHVIEEAREIEVTLFDGSSYRGKLIGQDPANDLAVLKVQAPANLLVPVAFGDSSRLRVGQRVFAIGNPFGLERTLTTGIISSLNRRIPGRQGRTLKSIIQTDAAINPGNSGGPLLDSHGRLIGVNTAIASRTGQNTGIGFAIPVNNIARIVPQLIEKGHVDRPEIGIAQVYETEQGLMISKLVPGGPAERAGLRGPKLVVKRREQGRFLYRYETIDRAAADIIVAIDGEKTTTADDFLGVIENKQPGDEVTLTVLRDGRETPVRVKLHESDD